MFEFNAVKGKPLRVSVESRRLGYPLDPVLRISDSKGKLLTETDTRSADKLMKRSTGLLLPTGNIKWRCEISLNRRERFVYRLTIEPPRRVAAQWKKGLGRGPKKDLKVALFAVGFRQACAVRTGDVPPGWKLGAVIPEPKGASAKAVTLKIQRSLMARPSVVRCGSLGRVKAKRSRGGCDGPVSASKRSPGNFPVVGGQAGGEKGGRKKK
ncbi:MAG: hypothetical protein Ct9H300mP1_15860 [Planctomycetaceae bacterium]|nr:MAG: hypothetical protein Ct9H300mP1_15860 [Planctomycetaceae bacterium]